MSKRKDDFQHTPGRIERAKEFAKNHKAELGALLAISALYVLNNHQQIDIVMDQVQFHLDRLQTLNEALNDPESTVNVHGLIRNTDIYVQIMMGSFEHILIPSAIEHMIVYIVMLLGIQFYKNSAESENEEDTFDQDPDTRRLEELFVDEEDDTDRLHIAKKNRQQ